MKSQVENMTNSKPEGAAALQAKPYIPLPVKEFLRLQELKIRAIKTHIDNLEALPCRDDVPFHSFGGSLAIENCCFDLIYGADILLLKIKARFTEDLKIFNLTNDFVQTEKMIINSITRNLQPIDGMRDSKLLRDRHTFERYLGKIRAALKDLNKAQKAYTLNLTMVTT